MNISLMIPDQMEAVLRRKAASLGKNLSEYLEQIVAEEAEEELPTPPLGESTEMFIARLKAMVARHAVRSGHVDDSRESIYAGRGE